ncbi:SET domain containing protein [Beauveria brongniartii RCEF 3172]|uniref:SET domain containing protein n=1 Tax=Beauveria brongniartii RCEF 3172 TaxID=1081107 RepID=A0A167EWR9_9HYPO|nr:SET domain containing protein [Beauveria brongniartii RCEF 3172]
MSKRDHDTVSRASHPDDFHLRSPAQPQPYTSLYFNPITAYTCPSAAIPPPSSILLGNGPPSHLASSGTKAYDSRSTTPASSASDLSDAPQNMKEISPPPPRRSQARTESQVPIASNAGTSTGAQPHSFPMQMPQFAAPPSRSFRASVVEKQWDKADLAKTLQEFLKGVRQDHSRLVAHAIEALEPTEWRVRNGADLFQGLGTGAVPQKKGETMRIKFKQHLKTRKDAREEHYEIKAIKTTTERVPRYRFHHVEIKKNVLTPNTMLTFVPHLRDLDSSEEPKYNLWLKELEQIDTESGFKPMNREEKVILTIQTERAATVSLYLDTWLEKLGIANCTKATLVAHMASQEPSDKMTPQQKSDIIRSSREATDGNSASQDARKAAALFTDAFKQVFDNDDLPLASRIELRRSLLLEESVDGVLDPKAAAKDAGTGTQGDVYKTAEAHLATFSILGCLICYSHSCDHGEYDKENLKQTFSLSAVMPLSDLLKQRRRKLGLESVGASNCELQRGGSQKLILGQSQLDGVGYGLFTAEDIAQDGFVIEYVGELITHDEGVRREARRGDVFDEESNISYVFTLLEHEGIWVDAATYGNLSRYINHATEHDRTGSNITPRILYVNGEFRIKFTALRDIQAGEELFFNYGENFPNLTKKLLDTKTGQKPVKPGRPPRSAASTGVARKAPKPEQKKMERKKPGARRRRRRTIVKDDDDDDDDMQSAYIPPLNRAVKRKRGLERTSSDEDMYHSRGSIPQTQWQESAAEDEDGLVEEATPNGSIRTRRILRTRASETPTKVDKVKAAGRRGGARPGSGRPRKHPRPVPKLVLETAEPARRLKDLATKSTWRDSLSESPRTMRQGRGEQDEYDEVGDSQEWSTAGEDDASKAYRQDLRGEEEEDEATSVNGVEDEEEEDDQDVVVRKRMDRATRNRRPPAKFRGDDF